MMSLVEFYLLIFVIIGVSYFLNFVFHAAFETVDTSLSQKQIALIKLNYLFPLAPFIVALCVVVYGFIIRQVKVLRG